MKTEKITYYWYCIPPIDIWEGVPSLSSYPWETQERGERILARLQDVAGIRSPISEPPHVFHLPEASQPLVGFLFKESHAGHTYAVSPRPLPWLDALDSGSLTIEKDSQLIATNKLIDKAADAAEAVLSDGGQLTPSALWEVADEVRERSFDVEQERETALLKQGKKSKSHTWEGGI